VPFFRAVSTIFFETPSDCPIASNKISTGVSLIYLKGFYKIIFYLL